MPTTNPRQSSTDADKDAKKSGVKNLQITVRFNNTANDDILRAYLTRNGHVAIDGTPTGNMWAKQLIADTIGADLTKEVKKQKTPKTALPEALQNMTAKDRKRAMDLALAEIAKNPEKFTEMIALLNSTATNLQQAEKNVQVAALENSVN